MARQLYDGCADAGASGCEAFCEADPAGCDAGTGPSCLGPAPCLPGIDAPAGGAAASSETSFALCTCEAYVGSDRLELVGDPASGWRAGLGTNGGLNMSAPVSLDGDLQVAGSAGVSLADGVTLTLGGDLRVGGPLRGNATVDTAGDAQVASDIQLSELAVQGTLTLPAGTALDADQLHTGAQQSGAVQVAEPCPCSDAELFDVANYVHAHRSDNDNAAAELDAFVLDGYVGGATLRLGCGRYHLSRVAGDGDLRLDVTAPARLLIDGALAVEGALQVQLAAGASLDVYVEGELRLAGPLRITGAGDPAGVRLHVGGGGTIDLAADTQLGGGLYAPAAELVTGGALEAHGPVLVRRLAASGPVTLHVTRPPDSARCMP